MEPIILLLVFVILLNIMCSSPHSTQLHIDKVLQSVGVDDRDACFRWALGDDYGTLLICKSHEIWNERHGDLFVLHSSDNFDEGLRRIGLAYVQYVQKLKLLELD